MKTMQKIIVLTALTCGLSYATTHAKMLLAIIESNPELSLFRQACSYGKADPVFTADENTPVIGGFVPFLVFAPNNAAMEKAGYSESKLESIAEEDGYDATDKKSQSETLRDFVKQHTAMKFSDTKENLKPTYERFVGSKLEIVNGAIKTASGSATIVGPNNQASNGMLHVIDMVLPE